MHETKVEAPLDDLRLKHSPSNAHTTLRSASLFLSPSSFVGGSPTASAITEARRREHALQQRLAQESESSFLKNPRTMIAGLTPEHMLEGVLKEWKAAEAKAAEENAKAARLGTGPTRTAIGIDEPAFVAIVGAAVQSRFPTLSFEYVAGLLSNLFVQLDAASIGVVSWETFITYLIDTADYILRDSHGEESSASGAEHVQQYRPKQVVLGEESHTSVNHVGSLLDVVVRIQILSNDPPLIACMTRGGALHIRDAAGCNVQVSHRLSGLVTASTFVANRILRQSVPGIFAVRSFLVVATSSMRLHLFASKKWELRSTVTIMELVTSLRHCDEDQFLYSGTRSGDILLWEVCPKGELVLRRAIRGIHRGAINDLIFISMYRCVSGSSDGTVVECSLGRIVWPTRSKHDSPTAVIEATCSEDCVFVFRECGGSVVTVTYSAALRQIIAVASDHSVRAFVESFPSVPCDVIVPPAIHTNSPPVIFAAVDPSDSFLYVADRSTLVQVFDLKGMIQVGSHLAVPQNKTLMVFAICAAVTSSGCLLLNTNAHLHFLRPEVGDEKDEECIVGDAHETVVAMSTHPSIPHAIIIIASSGIIIWDVVGAKRIAWHDNTYNTITAGCVDSSGSRAVLGSAVGELGVFRLDTGRSIRQYAMPSRGSEISAVQFGTVPRLIVAATERHEFVLCLDAHENEFGRCPILRVIPSVYGIRRLTVCIEQGLYLATDTQHQCRAFLYDAVECAVRFCKVGRRSDMIPAAGAPLRLRAFCVASQDTTGPTGEPLNAETTALCTLKPYPAFIMATVDGSISIFGTKPHPLGEQCVCRWKNKLDLNFDMMGGNDSSITSGLFGSNNDASNASFHGSPLSSSSLPPAVRLVIFLHPYCIVCADEGNRIVQWDISDVILQSRFVDPRSTKGRFAGDFFHEVARPPIIRCVAVTCIRSNSLMAGMTFLQPNFIAVVDEAGKASLFTITDQGLTSVRKIRGGGVGVSSGVNALPVDPRRSLSISTDNSQSSTRKSTTTTTVYRRPTAATSTAAPQPTKFAWRSFWRKYVCLIRVLWILTKYHRVASTTSLAHPSSFLHLRRSLSASGIAAVSAERAPFRTINACIIGLDASPDAPTFLCPSFEWSIDKEFARRSMRIPANAADSEGSPMHLSAHRGDRASMADLRPTLVAGTHRPQQCCHYRAPTAANVVTPTKRPLNLRQAIAEAAAASSPQQRDDYCHHHHQSRRHNVPDPLLSDELGLPADSPSLIRAFSNVHGYTPNQLRRDSATFGGRSGSSNGDDNDKATSSIDPRFGSPREKMPRSGGGFFAAGASSALPPRPSSAPPSRYRTTNISAAAAATATAGDAHAASCNCGAATFHTPQKSNTNSGSSLHRAHQARPSSASSRRAPLQGMLPPGAAANNLCEQTIRTLSSASCATTHRPHSAASSSPSWSASKDRIFVPCFTNDCPIRSTTVQTESVATICEMHRCRAQRNISRSFVHPSALRVTRRR